MGVRIAQLANFVGPSSGGMKTAVRALGAGYVAAGAERMLVVPGPCDARTSTEHGAVVQLRAPRVGGGYRLIVEPWRVVDALEEFGPTSIEVSDKSTLLPVTSWARRRDIPTLLFSHERLDAMLELRTGWRVGLGTPVDVLNRTLVRRFDGVVVTSDFARREFHDLALAAGTPLHQVALGVDLDTFRPTVSPVSPSRAPCAGRCGWSTWDGCRGRRARSSRWPPRCTCTAAATTSTSTSTATARSAPTSSGWPPGPARSPSTATSPTGAP